jgi:hypothetical protein
MENDALKCDQLDDLLLEATPQSMERAARHAAECASCAETLAEWNELSSTAASMRATWQSDLLWPRIRQAIRAERKRSLPRWIWQIAAVFILTAGLGATLFYVVRVQTREAAFDHTILRLTALDEVERAEQAHLDAIENLERLADAKLDAAETPLMISYREKLMLLDDAIAECRANADSNRQNAHLRRQLLAMYTDKQQTLQDVLREETNVPTP